MAGPGSEFSGPIISGTKKDADASGAANTGLCILTQSVTLTQNGTNTVDATVVVPYGSKVIDVLFDTPTAWNSGTSDTGSVGYTSGGTDIASGVAISAAGRVRPTFTGAQLTAMSDIGANTTLHVTATPVGTAATAGETIATIVYAQTVQLTQGTA